MAKKRSGAGIWLFIILLTAAACYFLSNKMVDNSEIAYSEFYKALEANAVSEIVRMEDKALVTINDKEYTVTFPEITDNEFDKKISENIRNGNLDYIIKEKGFSFVDIIIPLVTFLIIAFFILMLLRNQANKGANFTKSRARLNNQTKNKVSFENIAGAVEEKAELEEIVDFLKNPQKFTDLGARIPKGVLLVGPPGTGKTLLARAVAGEANVPFFSISGSDFVELYVGVGAARVRDMFETAKKNKPCIIFVDEIDAVGRKRGAGMGGGHDEREQTLNQLLVEMDGFGVNEGIIMIAATNRPDILDPALLRPGRFDRQIVVGIPDVKGREEILKVHSKKKPLDENVDLSKIAKVTTGYTGADLENVLNEAAIIAAKKNENKITNDDIEEANLKVMMGAEKKSKVITEKDKKLTAYHEAGHAITSKLLGSKDKVHKISIIPRGSAGGFTMNRPEEGNDYDSKGEMYTEITVLLGGRIAEQLVLDDISTGASNDIQKATNIARQMVTKYGMSEKVGPVCYDNQEEVFIGRDYGHSKMYSDQTAYEIDNEVKTILKEQYKKGVELLQGNINILHELAKTLLEKETIDGEEFELIMNKFNV